MQDDLFGLKKRNESSRIGKEPLASRLRPTQLEEFLGSLDLASDSEPLRNWILKDEVPSLLLWGPPGCGKTSLALLIKKHSQAEFVELSGVRTGSKEMKQILDRAEENRRNSKKTLLFLDEIHRLNRAQQDVLLPAVERGDVSLIGATTENPSFEINSALLSRMHLITLKPLPDDGLVELARRALQTVPGGAFRNSPEESWLLLFAQAAQGDARRLLNSIENSLVSGSGSYRGKLS